MIHKVATELVIVGSSSSLVVKVGIGECQDRISQQAFEHLLGREAEPVGLADGLLGIRVPAVWARSASPL